MGDSDYSLLEQMLYSMNRVDVMNRLSESRDSLLLHHFVANYNWDDGFDIPNVILDNDCCDFGTGLLMFHYADGYDMLAGMDDVICEPLDKRILFLDKVYTKIINLDFNHQGISFDPGLTKVQKYKLKKSKPNISDVIINASPGILVDSPII